MRAVEVDTVKVSRIQRCFRVKRAMRKFKCLKFVDLHKRLNSFFVKINSRTLHNTPSDKNAYNQLSGETIREYNALRWAITPIREELLHILLGKMYGKVGLTQFCKQISNIIIEEECIGLRSRLVCIRAGCSDAHLHWKRMDHFRTGCEEEKLVMSGAQEVKTLLATFCDAVICGPKQEVAWQNEHAWIQSKLEFLSRRFYDYVQWKNEVDVLLNLECVMQIHWYKEAYERTKDAIAHELGSTPSEQYYSQIDTFMTDCQWTRKYIHERICRLRPSMRPPANTPNKILLGRYTGFHECYAPYLEADGSLKLPEGPEPEKIKDSVLLKNQKSIHVHPPSWATLNTILKSYFEMQNTAHKDEKKPFLTDENEWHEKTVKQMLTLRLSNRFHYISFSADLMKTFHQLRNPYPASSVLVYLLNYFRLECLFIKAIISKLQGSDDANFDIPKFQNGDSFVFHRSNWIVGSVCRYDSDDDDPEHQDSLNLVADYLTKIDECLRQMKYYVLAKGFLTKIHNISDMQEMLTKDCAKHLPSVDFPTFSDMWESFNNKETRTALSLATEIVQFLLYTFIKKEVVKQNIIAAYFLQELKKKDASFQAEVPMGF